MNRCLNSADLWERNHREYERWMSGLDIGAGANKTLNFGCDIRPISDFRCDAQHLPFRDKTFIITVLRHLLEHTEDWRKAFAEAQRVSYYTIIYMPKRNVWHGSAKEIYIPNAKYLRSHYWSHVYIVENPVCDTELQWQRQHPIPLLQP